MAALALLRDNLKKLLSSFGKASQASPADFQALSLRGLCFRALNREAEAPPPSSSA